VLQPVEESIADYKAKSREYITPQDFVAFVKCPYEFKLQREGLVTRPRSAHSALRRAVALMAFGLQDRLDQEFAVGGPINEKTGKPYGLNTKAYAYWLAKQNKQYSLDADGYSRALDMSGIVRERMASMFVGGKDVTLRTTDMCHSRVDCVSKIGSSVEITQILVCDNLDDFGWDIKKFNIPLRAAFMAYCAKTYDTASISIYFIVVENRPVLRCGVWGMSSEEINEQFTAVNSHLRWMKECQTANHWPTGYEQPRNLIAHF
jgi:hypothetical protein